MSDDPEVPIMRWHEEGSDPDYRFSLANERTYLAWIRTALAILAGAVLLRQFAIDVRPHALLLVIGAMLAVLAGVLGGGAYFRWRGNEHAMRLGRSLPRTLLVPVLSVAVAFASAAAVVIAAWP